jgi:hypothetical protein
LGLYSSHPIAGSAWYNEMVARAQDAGQGYLVNSLILRTMQQARYSRKIPAISVWQPLFIATSPLPSGAIPIL